MTRMTLSSPSVRRAIAITASIGVTVAAADSNGRCLDAMLHSSDAAMYRAKQLGGNTVAFAD